MVVLRSACGVFFVTLQNPRGHEERGLSSFNGKDEVAIRTYVDGQRFLERKASISNRPYGFQGQLACALAPGSGGRDDWILSSCPDRSESFRARPRVQRDDFDCRRHP